MEKYIKVLRFISGPFEPQQFSFLRKDPAEESLTPKILLESILSTCLTELGMKEKDLEYQNQNFIKIFNPVVSNTWKLSCIILKILCQLKNELEKIEEDQTIDENKIELLSLQDKIYIQKCIEILIGFGVLPYLVDAFNQDIQQKSPYFKVSQEFVKPDRQLSDLEKFSRLDHLLKQVLEFTNYSTLFEIVFPRYLNEFLAALVQETKLPLARPKDGTSSSGPCEKLTHSQFNYVMACREVFNDEIIPQLFARIPKKFLVTSVLIIGGSGARHIWLQRACTTILFETMCSPYGFMVTCQAIYENLGGNDCDIWKVTRVVSSLLRSSFNICFSINAEDEKFKILKPKELPSGRSLLLAEPTSMMSEICRQSVQMISASTTMNKSGGYNNNGGRRSRSDQNKNVDSNSISSIIEANKNMSYIGIVSVFTLMEFNAQLIHEMVFTPIFSPILNLSQGQASANQVIYSHVDQLIDCVRIAEALLITRHSIDLSYTTENPSNIVRIPVLEDVFFQPIWSTIFQMYTTSYKYLSQDREEQESEIVANCTKLLNACSDVIFLLFELSTERVSALGQCFSVLFLNQVWKMKMSVERIYYLYWLNEFKLEYTLTKASITSLNPRGRNQNNISQNIVQIERQCIDKNDDGYPDTIKSLSSDVQILCQVFLKNSRLSQFSSQLLMETLSYKQDSGSINDIQIEEIEIESSMTRGNSTNSANKSNDSSGSETDYKYQENEILDNLRISEMNQNQQEPNYEDKELNLEDRIVRLMNKYRNFVAIKLYQDLGTVEPLVDVNVGQSSEDNLKFLEVVMKKFVNDAESSQNQNIENQFPYSQSLILSLRILDTFIESLCNDQYNYFNGNFNLKPTTRITFQEPGPVWKKLKSFIPILDKFKDTKDVQLVQKGVPEQIKSLLYTIETSGEFYSADGGVNNKDRVQGPKLKLSRWDLAMKNSISYQPPIKGHGLLELRKLIDENDPTANSLENLKMLVELFEKEMKCDDSYVYLMAIYGLASLGHKHPQYVIPTLCDEYSQVKTFTDPDHHAYDSEGMIEEMNFRMKVGEVLVKVVGKLGDLAVNYRVKLINTFFHVVRDEDPLIKASALSNMGELCHILKFNLGMVLTEVWNLVHDILKSEESVHVRRAALHLIVMCLKGVSKDFDQEMSDFLMKNLEIGQYLRDVRRFLMELRQNEPDSVALVHIQLALEELDRIAVGLIATQNSLEVKFRNLGINLDRKS